jgi:hypothetical protein
MRPVEEFLMKSKFFLVLLGLFVILPVSASHARTYYDVHVGIGNSSGFVLFDSYPAVVRVPSSRVYVVEDCEPDYDVYRYGDYWYACRDDHWYRASGYRSPFYAVRIAYVPRAVRYVPVRYRDYGAREYGYRYADYRDYPRPRYYRGACDVSSGKHRWKHEHGHGHHHDDDD